MQGMIPHAGPGFASTWNTIHLAPRFFNVIPMPTLC
jgi:hypothetical protein